MLANAQSKVMKTSRSFNKKTGDRRVSGKEYGGKESGAKEWGASGKGPRRRYIRHLQLEHRTTQRGMSSYNCTEETMKSPALVVG